MRYEKLQNVSNLSSFGIVLVVLGHSCPTLGITGEPVAAVIYGFRTLAYAFHMPLFAFIAGFLFIHTNPGVENIKYAEFIYKKAIRLLTPYLLISTIAFPIKAALSQYALAPCGFEFSKLYPIFNFSL